ncbi:MAG: PilZ domain-containing protein [Pseudomonadota bacterium]
MDTYVDLHVKFSDFKELDIKKLENTITHNQLIKWTELHDYLMLELFDIHLEMFQEQREALRVPLNIAIEYKKNKIKFNTITRDISIHGICLPYNEEVYVGDEVDVYFYIGYKWKVVNWKKKFKLRGMVRWARPNQQALGVEFFDMKIEDKRHIQNLIFWNLEKIIQKRKNLT